MTGRVIAWAFVLSLVGVGYYGWSKWHNPWASPGVVGMLPKMTKCAEDCK